MSEIDDIRMQRMAEMQAEAQEQLKLQQQVQQLEASVKQLLTKEAQERYGNLKAAHPDKAIQVLVVLAQMVQSGKATIIDDDTLKRILMQLTPKKRDFAIKRK